MFENKALYLLILFLSCAIPRVQTTDTFMRNLIIISDVINQDDDPDPEAINKFFDNTIFTPGPTGEILRDMLREKCAPIFVSKNLFQRFYNFSTFAHDVVEQKATFIKKKYGSHVIPTKFHKDDFVESLQTLVKFLLQQHTIAQAHVNKMLKQKVNPLKTQKETLEYLKEQNYTTEDFNILVKQLGLEFYPLMPFLARNVMMFYKSFIANEWSTYVTRNGNYFMIPDNYCDKDFGMRYLYKTEPNTAHLPIDIQQEKIETKFAGKLFTEDLDLLINGIENSRKKPLRAFMTGHGSLPQDNASSGISLTDFHNLISILGRGNTYAFFYLTCHAGGTTTQDVWFTDRPKMKDSNIPISDSIYHAPFITIVSPATEIAFSRRSPFWMDTFETNKSDYFARWFLNKKMPPCITLPRIQDFFSLITQSMPKALENSLYIPLYTIYSEDRSIIIPQAALIKLPGTQWFYPQFFNETVFEINKTKSAQAFYMKKPLVQPLISNVITIATPTIYAPLVIHQKEALKIVPLLPVDPSYSTTKNHITYIKKLIIKSSAYDDEQNILWNLSYNNIGPCMIIPTTNDNKPKNDVQKVCIIDEILNPKSQVIARNFTITAQGTFYTNKNNKLVRFTQETPSPQTIGKTLTGVFNRVQHAVNELLKQDEAAKNSSQTVLHKVKVMKALDTMLKKRINKESS